MAVQVIIWGLPDDISKDGLENIVKAIRGVFKKLHFNPKGIAVWMPKDLLPLDLGNNIGIFVEGWRCDMIAKSKRCPDGYPDLPDDLANALLDLWKLFIIPNYVKHCQELDIFIRDPWGDYDDESIHASWKKKSQPNKEIVGK